jgi:single-strand DNA-binding protein
MADLNKVFLMGRLTTDPDLRRTPSGTAVTELRIATTRAWPGRDGERREETLFIDVTVWDRQAENCCEFLRKGSSVHVEGNLRLDTWEDKTSGEKRSRVRVIAERVQFLDSRRGDAGGTPDDDVAAAPPTARESGTRRATASSRSNGGSSEARSGNGAGRSASLPSTAADQHAGGESDHGEDDDIPF